jgi:anti-sigma factor RsiW
MNRSNIRPFPTPGAADAGAVGAAEAELVALFGDLIARGEREEESPDYDLLEAAVDGRLDPVESERFESRLAGDPVLTREFNDLMALRQRSQSPADSVRRAVPAAHRRWVGYAAAAVLLAAAGLGLRQDQRPTETTSASFSRQTAQAAMRSPGATVPSSGREVVFTDSFEGGTTDHWSN